MTCHSDPSFVSAREREALLDWLAGIHPIWEMRYASSRGEGEAAQRRLLRPVYWLGSWQFACLDYYRPPDGVRDRCVLAEPFPDVLAQMVERIETLARRSYRAPDLPDDWRLNTCLVNLYGSRFDGGRRVDCARVGEHRDFEPGPVASISLGERALFQFVTPGGRGRPSRIVAQHWLEDRSLLVFGGEQWKRRTLHRVARVDRRDGHHFPTGVCDFETRRVNLTLRYVPDEHVVRYARLSLSTREDVRGYVTELALHSTFFKEELRRAGELPSGGLE